MNGLFSKFKKLNISRRDARFVKAIRFLSLVCVLGIITIAGISVVNEKRFDSYADTLLSGSNIPDVTWAGSYTWAFDDQGVLTVNCNGYEGYEVDSNGYGESTKNLVWSFIGAKPTPDASQSIDTVVKKIVFTGTLDEASFYDAFSSFTNCTEIDMSGLTVNKLSNAKNMFNGLANLQTVKLPLNFNIADASYMFYNCKALTTITNLDTLKFDTTGSNCPLTACNLECMFRECKKLTNIDISSLTSAGTVSLFRTFYNCSKVETITLPTEGLNVTNMEGSFYWCGVLLQIENLDKLNLSNCDNFYQAFMFCYVLQSINFSKSHLIYASKISSMFNGCRTLDTIDISMFRTENYNNSSATETGSAFNGCSNATTIILPEEGFRAKGVSSMFSACKIIEEITNLDKMKLYVGCTSLDNMFCDCYKLKKANLDSEFDASYVTSMTCMYKNCYSLTEINLSNFAVYGDYPAKLTNCTGMFENCINLRKITLPSDDKFFNSCTSFNHMFEFCVTLQEIYNLDRMDTSNSKNFQNMFFMNKALKNEHYVGLNDTSNYNNFSKFDMSSAEVLMGMFDGCLGLTTIDISSWGTTLALYDLTSVFDYCENLETVVGLERLYIDNVSSTANMFRNCKKLTTETANKVGLWNIPTVASGKNKLAAICGMFKNCESITELNVPNFELGGSRPYVYALSGNYESFAFNSSDSTDKTAFGMARDVMNFVFTFYGSSGSFSYSDIVPSSASYINNKTKANTIYTDTRDDIARDTNKDIVYYGENLYDKHASGFVQGCKNLETLDISGLDFENCHTVYSASKDTFNDSNFFGSYYIVNEYAEYEYIDGNEIDYSNLLKNGDEPVLIKPIDRVNHSSSHIPPENLALAYDCPKLKSVTLNANLTSLGVAFYEYNYFTFGSQSYQFLRSYASKSSALTSFFSDSNVMTHSLTSKKMPESASSTTKMKGEDYYLNADLFGIPDEDLPQGESYVPLEINFNGPATTLAKSLLTGVSDGALVHEKANGYEYYYTSSSEYPGYNYEADNRDAEIIAPVIAWDISQASNGSVMAKLYDNGDLIISGTGIVNANVNSTLSSSRNPWYGTEYNDQIKNIIIKDSCEAWSLNGSLYSWFSNLPNLVSADISKLDASNATSFDSMFKNCPNLEYVNLSGINTQNIINLSSMFSGCKSLTSCNLSGWDTSNVTDMGSMFYQCEALETIDVSGWNTSNVTDMSCMFEECLSLKSLGEQNVSGWVTSNVTDMYSMFTNCEALETLDVSNWNTSNVTDMDYIFESCSSLETLDVSNWNTSNVTEMYGIFLNCSSLETIDVSKWDTSNVTSMGLMFTGCSSLNSLDISKWDFSEVTELAGFIDGCTNLKSIDLSKINFNEDLITNLSIPSVMVESYYLARNCDNLTEITFGEDLSSFGSYISMNGPGDTTTGLVTSGLFYVDSDTPLKTYIYIPDSKANDETYKGIINSYNWASDNREIEIVAPIKTWDISSLQNGSIMADLYSNGELVISGSGALHSSSNSIKSSSTSSYKDNNVINPWLATEYANQIKSIKFKEGNSIYANIWIENWFGGLVNLKSVDFTNYNAEKATSLAYLFTGCTSLTSVDMSNFVTSNPETGLVVSCEHMFDGCINLREVILPNDPNFFKKCTDFSHMFMYDVSLQKIYNLDKIDTSKGKYFFETFFFCKNLLNEYIDEDDSSKNYNNFSHLNMSSAILLMGMFDECVSLTEIDISSWHTTPLLEDLTSVFDYCENLETVTGLENLCMTNVSSTANMFRNCKKLSTETANKVGEWVIPSVASGNNKLAAICGMFKNCESIEYLDVSNFELGGDRAYVYAYDYSVNNNTSEIYYVLKHTSPLARLYNQSNATMLASGSSPVFYKDKDISQINTYGSNNSGYRGSQMYPRHASGFVDGCINLESLDISGLDFNDCNTIYNGATNISFDFGSSTNKITTYYAINEFITGFKYSDGTDVVIGGDLKVDANGNPVLITDITTDKTKLLGTTSFSDYRFGEKLGLCYNCPSLTKITFNKNLTSLGTAFHDLELSNKGLVSNAGKVLQTISFAHPDNKLTSKFTLKYDPSTSSVDDRVSDSDFFVNASLFGIDNELLPTGVSLVPLEITFNGEPTPTALKLLSNLDKTKVTYPGGSNTYNLATKDGDDNYIYPGYNYEADNRELLMPIASWDISEERDESVMATLYDNGDMFITGEGYISSDANLRRPWENDLEKKALIERVIVKDNVTAAGDLSYMFNGMSNLKYADISKINTNVPECKDLSWLFRDDVKLEEVVLPSDLVNSNTENISLIFYYCKALTSLDVSGWDVSNVTNMSTAFQWCSNLTTLDVSDWDISSCEDMSYLFSACMKLNNLNLSSWDTSNVINMAGVFGDCYALNNVNITGWDTSSVTNMNYMFYANPSVSLNVSGFDTSNVTSMEGMFSYSQNLKSLDLSGWNTENVTNMYRMFDHCCGLTSLDVSNFDVKKVTNMDNIFDSLENLETLNLSKWSCDALTSCYRALHWCIKLKEIDLSGFGDLARLTNCNITYTYDVPGGTLTGMTQDGMLGYSNSLTTIKLGEDLTGFGKANVTTKVTSPESSNTESNVPVSKTQFYVDSTTPLETTIFVPASKINDEEYLAVINGYDWAADNRSITILAIIKEWDISELQDKSLMATLYSNGDLIITGNGDIGSGVIHMWHGRSGSTRNPWYIDYSCQDMIKRVIVKDNCKPADSISHWFDELHNVEEIDISKVNTNLSTCIDLEGIFANCYKLTKLSLPDNFVNEYIQDISDMFSNCNELAELDVSDWNTKNVSYAKNVFSRCYSLEELNVSNFNVGNVTTMYNMFYSCSSLEELDVSDWNVSQVKNMCGMFSGCSSIEELDLSNWTNNLVTDMDNMFSECSLLEEVDISNISLENVSDICGIFDHCTNLGKVTFSDTTTLELNNYYGLFDYCSNLKEIDLSPLTACSEGYRTRYCRKNIQGEDETIDYDYRVASYCDNLTTIKFGEDLSDFGYGYTYIAYYEGENYLGSNYEYEDNINSSLFFVDQEELLKTDIIIPSSKANDADYKNIIINYGVDANGVSWGLDNRTINIYAGSKKPENLVYVSFDPEFEGQEDTWYTDKDNNGISDWLEKFNVVTKNDTTKVISELSLKDKEVEQAINMYSRGIYNNVIYNVNLTTMNSLFISSKITSFDSHDLDTSNVGNMVGLFKDCTLLESADLSNFNMTNINNISAIFDGCSSLTSLNVDGWDTQNVTYMTDTFKGCSSLTSLDLTSWTDTSKVLYFNDTFNGCSSLTSLDVSNWDTSGAKYLEGTFKGCSSLTSLDVANWDVSNVATMYETFRDCSSLTSLDLSKWNTESCKYMRGFFTGCTSLASIDISDLNLTKLEAVDGMFEGCSSITKIDLTNVLVNDTIETCAFVQIYDLEDNLIDEQSSIMYLLKDCDSLTEITLGENFDGFGKYYIMDLSYAHPETYRNETIDANEKVFFVDRVLPLRTNIIIPSSKAGDTDYLDAIKEYDWLGDNRLISVYKDTIKDANLIYSMPDFDPDSVKDENENGISDWLENFDILDKDDDTRVIDEVRLKSEGYSLDINMYSRGLYNNKVYDVKLFDMDVVFLNSNITSFNSHDLDTSNVGSFYCLFANCKDLETITFGENFTAGRGGDFSGMFGGCSSITSLTIPETFDVSGLEHTYMDYMFADMENLIYLTLPSTFTTKNASTIYRMFSGDINLSSLDFSMIDAGKAYGIGSVFARTALEEIDLSTFKSSLYNEAASDGTFTCNAGEFFSAFQDDIENGLASKSQFEKITFGKDFDIRTVHMFDEITFADEGVFKNQFFYIGGLAPTPEYMNTKVVFKNYTGLTETDKNNYKSLMDYIVNADGSGYDWEEDYRIIFNPSIKDYSEKTPSLGDTEVLVGSVNEPTVYVEYGDDSIYKDGPNYIWQKKNEEDGTWSDLTASDSSTYNTSELKLVPSSETKGYYRCKVTNGPLVYAPSDREVFFNVNVEHTLTVTSEDETKGTVNDVSGLYVVGDEVTAVATPLANHGFKGWYNGDTLVSSDKSYTFNMPDSDYTLTAKFTDLRIDITGEYTFNKSQITPTFKVYDGDNEIDSSNYEVSYGDNIHAGLGAGSVTVTFKDASPYTGSITENFDINKYDLSLTVSVDTQHKVYDGSNLILPIGHNTSTGKQVPNIGLAQVIYTYEFTDKKAEVDKALLCKINNISYPTGTLESDFNITGFKFEVGEDTLDKTTEFLGGTREFTIPSNSYIEHLELEYTYEGDKVYDGTSDANVEFTLTNVLEGDDLTLTNATLTGDYVNGGNPTSEVGTDYNIVLDSGETFILSGDDKDNYSVPAISGLKGDIKVLGIEATTVENLTDLTYTGLVAEPVFYLSFNGHYVYDSDYEVVCTEIDATDSAEATIIGHGNYEGSSRTITFKILPKDVTISLWDYRDNYDVDEDKKEYDTTDTYYFDVANKVSEKHITKDGVNGEVLNFTLEGHYSDPFVNGLEIKPITFSGNFDSVTGGRAKTSNYNVIYTNSTVNTGQIRYKEVYYTATGVDKVYDGTCDAEITIALDDPSGIFECDKDDVSIVPLTIRGAFASPDISDEPIVISPLAQPSLQGDKAGNYYVTYIQYKPEIISAMITNKLISSNSVSVSLTGTYTYTGSEITPSITITDNESGEDVTLEEGTDYELSYSDNINAGTCTVTITGEGNYSGSREVTFTISEYRIDVDLASYLTNKEKVYDGNNYYYFESDSTDNSYHVTYDGVNGEKINDIIYATYDTKDVGNTKTITVSLGDDSNTVTGGNGKISNYKLVFSNNEVNDGVITARDFSTDAVISNLEESYTYEGKEIIPDITLTLDGLGTLYKGTDYEVNVTNNINVGKATLTITGKNNYLGSSITKTFDITTKEVTIDVSSYAVNREKIFDGNNKYSFSKDTFTENYSGQVNGCENEKINFTLSGTYDDEKVGPNKNINMTYSFDSVTGGNASKDNYDVKFINYEYSNGEIKGKTTESAETSISGIDPWYYYTGLPITPSVTLEVDGVTLNEGEDKDFTVTYEDNTEVGQATVTIAGCGNYVGTNVLHFEIRKAPLELSNVSLRRKSDNTLVTKINPLSKERDGDEKFKEEVELFFENENTHEIITFTYDDNNSYYTSSDASPYAKEKLASTNDSSLFTDEDNLINLIFTGINISSNNHYTANFTDGVKLFNDHGFIYDEIDPVITVNGVTCNSAYYGKGQTITVTLTMSEDVKSDIDASNVYLTLETMGGNTIGNAIFDSVTNGNEINFKYEIPLDSDSTINTEGIKVNLLRESGKNIYDLAGNPLGTLGADLNNLEAEINVSGFSVSIVPEEDDNTNSDKVHFDITLGVSGVNNLSAYDASSLITKLKIETKAHELDDSSYEEIDMTNTSLYSLTKVNGNEYKLELSSNLLCKSTDTSGRDIRVSIAKDALCDSDSNYNIYMEGDLLTNRVLDNSVRAILADGITEAIKLEVNEINKIFKGDVITFTKDNTLATAINYILGSDGASTVITKNNSDVPFTLTMNANELVKDIYESLSTYVSSIKVAFKFELETITDVVSKINNETSSSNLASYLTKEGTATGTFDLINESDNRPETSISESDYNSYINHISERLIDISSDPYEKDITESNIKEIIHDIINNKKKLDDFITTDIPDITDDTFLSDIESYKVRYEDLDSFSKEYLMSNYPDEINKLNTKYYEFIESKKHETVDKISQGAEEIEVFGVNKSSDIASTDSVVLKVVKITDKDKSKEISDKVISNITPTYDKLVNGRLMIPYDISLVKKSNTNEEVELKAGEKVLVRLTLPIEYYNRIVDVYHIAKNGDFDGKIETKMQNINGVTYVYFYAESFSPFAVFGDVPTILVSTSGEGKLSKVSPTIKGYSDQNDEDFEISLDSNLKAKVTASYFDEDDNKKVTLMTKDISSSQTVTIPKEILKVPYDKDCNIELNVEFIKDESKNEEEKKEIKVTTGTIITVQTLDHASYINGYKDKTFKPNGKMTRGEASAMFARLSKTFSESKDYRDYAIKKYKDFNENDNRWYTNYIGYLTANGILEGNEKGMFNPDKYMTRAEFTAAVIRFINLDLIKTDIKIFNDYKDKWYKDEVDTLAWYGFVNGYKDGSFKGYNPVTRAEATKILNNVLYRSVKDKKSITDYYKNIMANTFTDVKEGKWYYEDILEAAISHSSREH